MNMIALNAGATIYLAGLADSHQQGVAKALEIIQTGQALEKIAQFGKIYPTICKIMFKKFGKNMTHEVPSVFKKNR